MSKSSTWMPLYIGDYLGDTQRLTTEQHGAYLLLILDYWRNGPAPDDDLVLQQITKLERAAWKRHRPALARLFQIADGEWRHKRIDKELAEASENAERRSNKARDGADAKWGDSADGAKGRHLRSERLAAARQIATHTAAEWERMKEVCGHICVRCGAEGSLVKDHITPIYRGGSDGIDNLQPLCKSCNSSKGPEATDHRPNDWQNAFEMPARMPPNASASPSPQKFIEANASIVEVADFDEPDPDSLKPEHFVEAWNDLATRIGRPQVRDLTPERRQKLKARINGHSIDDFQQVLGSIEKSPFLRGEKAWSGATFDWVLGKGNFQKILEGNYDR